MLAHVNGQTLNSSKLAGSMGVSAHAIRNYVDLLEIESREQLFSSPIYGASFESYVIENILVSIQAQDGPQWRPSFYRTSNGAEIDLVLEKGQQRIAVEIKSSTAPKVSRGFWNAIEDINSTANYVIAPVESAYPLAKNVRVMNLGGFVTELLG